MSSRSDDRELLSQLQHAKVRFIATMVNLASFAACVRYLGSKLKNGLIS